jgi:hypothetical protein
MNLEPLRQRMLAAARANPPADRVPYAFEQRIMARLVAPPALDLGELWARALWRAAAPCVALTLLFGVWSFVGAQNNSGATSLTDGADFAQHFEQTMLAAVEEPAEEIW